MAGCGTVGHAQATTTSRARPRAPLHFCRAGPRMAFMARLHSDLSAPRKVTSRTRLLPLYQPGWVGWSTCPALSPTSPRPRGSRLEPSSQLSDPAETAAAVSLAAAGRALWWRWPPPPSPLPLTPLLPWPRTPPSSLPPPPPPPPPLPLLAVTPGGLCEGRRSLRAPRSGPPLCIREVWGKTHPALSTSLRLGRRIWRRRHQWKCRSEGHHNLPRV